MNELKRLKEELMNLMDDRRELNDKHNHTATVRDVMNNIDDIQQVKERIHELECGV